MRQQQPAAPLKAWYCDDGDEAGAIVYAPTRGRARWLGTGRLDAEFIDVSARRAPQWDALAPKGPTNEQLFNAGWWFDCDCGRRACAGDGEADWIDGQAVCHDCAVSRNPDARPMCAHHPDRVSRVNLDSEELCQECADAWVRGEGQHAAWLEAEEREGKAP